jgi:hypothetical protein
MLKSTTASLKPSEVDGPLTAQIIWYFNTANEIPH